jgi:hypothetical protein
MSSSPTIAVQFRWQRVLCSVIFRHKDVLKVTQYSRSTQYNNENQKFGMENVGFTAISLYILHVL